MNNTASHRRRIAALAIVTRYLRPRRADRAENWPAELIPFGKENRPSSNKNGKDDTRETAEHNPGNCETRGLVAHFLTL